MNYHASFIALLVSFTAYFLLAVLEMYFSIGEELNWFENKFSSRCVTIRKTIIILLFVIFIATAYFS